MDKHSKKHGDIEQTLWDYVYGLLDDDQVAAIEERIQLELDVAQALVAVKSKAALVASAAKLEAPSIALTAPADDSAPRSKVTKSKSKSDRRHQRTERSRRTSRGATWLVSLATAALVLFTLFAYLKPKSLINAEAVKHAEQQIARRYARVTISGPAKVSPSVENYYTVKTTAMNGEAMPQDVQYRLYDTRTGELQLQRTGRTNNHGQLLVTLPPDKISPTCRLEVRTTNNGEATGVLETHLVVDPIKHVAHVSTDKPLYRPGETVYFRSLTLSRFGLRDDRDLPVQFEIHDPAGTVIAESVQNGFTNHGVGNGMFPVSPDRPGGKYTLVARSLGDQFAETKREFIVQDYRTPRLKKELEFTRDSYSAGDEVIADFSAARAEGGSIGEAALRISATVDEQTIAVEPADPKLNSDGTYRVKFRLPEKIEKGAATLSVAVDDGGTQETIAKAIPINLGKVEVTFYPEGGDLVAGLESRVYFHAVDPLGKPVHINGRIVDGDGHEIVRVETNEKAEGRGVFRFTPTKKQTYQLEIDKPTEVVGEFSLPSTNAERFVVLETSDDVTKAGQPINMSIRTTKDAPLVVAAVCRDVHVGQQELEKSGNVKLNLPPQADGVIRLTIYDYTQTPPKPLAERLVFRESTRKLNVKYENDWDEYSPGQHVKAAIVVTDEKDQPVPAALGISVVDDALLNLADDKSPRMITNFMLTNDLENPEDIEDTNFFISDESDAREALDLLLGTQGWRRFTDIDADKIAKANLRRAAIEALNRGEPIDAKLAKLSEATNAMSPPLVFDNLRAVTPEYNTSLFVFRSARESAIQLAGQIVFFGAIGIMALLIMLALLRLSSGWKILLTALSTATGCLAVGFVWMSSVIDHRGEVAMVPFANFGMDARRVQTVNNMRQHGVAMQDDHERWGRPTPHYLNDNVYFWDKPSDEWNRLHRDFVQWGDFDPIRIQEFEMAYRFQVPVAGNDKEFWKFNAFFTRNLNEGGEVLGERPRQAELFGLDLANNDGARRYDDWSHWRGWAYTPAHGASNVMIGQQALQHRLRFAIESGDVRSASELIEQYNAAMDKVRFPVRQYAHKHESNSQSVRTDFRETLYWNPLMIADANGRVDVEFDLSDSVTTYRVMADAHSRGRLGSGEGEVVSRIPFSLEPKLPLEVTAGDRIDLPLAVNNDTGAELPVKLSCVHNDLLALGMADERSIAMPANKRQREYFTFDVIGNTGDAELEFRGSAAALTDAIKKSIRVVPPGFPVSQSYAGRIDGQQELTVVLPDDWVDGSLEMTLQAYPSALADLDRGIDGILREPYGCFEQTSSANYPNVMGLRFMQEHNIADPEFTRKAKELLKKGYARLVSFECSKRGYEWFGKDPGHEALTAYGLLEFRDMTSVWDVDQTMVARTSEWLMSLRDGQGGFKRNSRSLDSFGGASPEITNAYIVWALSESGQTGIDKEIDHVVDTAKQSDDPYLISLAAASASNAKHTASDLLLTKLAALQEDDGHLDGKSGSITRSGGKSLQVETTSLAALAWLKDSKYASNVVKAIQWITNNRQGNGGFGSTQATVLALKALIEDATASRRSLTDGELIVQVNGQQAALASFKAGTRHAIVLKNISDHMKPGGNELSLELTNKNQMPYSLEVGYRTRKPVSDDACPVRLSTKLAADKIKAGEVVPLSFELSNESGEGQPMTIAIVGLPAGLEVRPKQLEELHEAGQFDYYETNGRELIFYWRSLGPDIQGDKKITFDVDLIAEIPGRYESPASRTYLYYTAEHKHWVTPLKINIERN